MKLFPPIMLNCLFDYLVFSRALKREVTNLSLSFDNKHVTLREPPLLTKQNSYVKLIGGFYFLLMGELEKRRRQSDLLRSATCLQPIHAAYARILRSFSNFGKLLYLKIPILLYNFFSTKISQPDAAEELLKVPQMTFIILNKKGIITLMP